MPYLEATSQLSPAQLSIIVAAVLLGSVFSTLFAGLLADWMGRKPLMILSGPPSSSASRSSRFRTATLRCFFGRLLQGMSGGFIGIVVPLYLAECLSASTRGKGTGVFQWLLTFGIVAAALVGIYFSYRVDAVARTADADALLRLQKRGMAQHLLGFASSRRAICHRQLHGHRISALALRRGKIEQARAALLRSRSPEQATIELQEMEARIANADRGPLARKSATRCCAANTSFRSCWPASSSPATRPPASTPSSATTPASCCKAACPTFMRTGDMCSSRWSTSLMTIVGMTLVDRKGRKFLFILGTSGIIVSMRDRGHHLSQDGTTERRCRAARFSRWSGLIRN